MRTRFMLLYRTLQSEVKLKKSATELQNVTSRFFSEGGAAGGAGVRARADAAEDARTAAAPTTTATLSDSLGRRHNYLRISLTERCNLRCQYCMPTEGVPLSAREALLARGELAALVRVLAGVGVDKLRLTGGEPTLRPDLADIVAELSAVPGIRSVSMTTNGLVLTRRLVALQRAGLAALNISLDSLQPARYETMSRRPAAGLARVLAGVDLALQLRVPVKINTVLMKGFNDDEICDFVEFTKDREVEVRFIEFMPFSGNAWDDSKLVPYRAALRAVQRRHPALEPALPRPHDTARVWRVPGYKGHVGFISSMTDHFCGSCNRLRLTADGNLKVCLFGAAEVSLRDALRGGASEPELVALVRRALAGKKPQHAGEWAAVTPAPAPASRIDLAQSLPYCRHAESRQYGEPPHDTDRRLAQARALPCLFTARLGAAAGAGATVRAYSTRAAGDGGEGEVEDEEEQEGPFSHLDGSGAARMVDVSGKPVTRRVAVASCRLEVGARLLRLLRDARLPKGDAMCVARVAGVLAAKRTADLIPLCHPLPLELARVTVTLPTARDDNAGGALTVRCEVRVTARTGAEMEALTGCAVAALALYDMCKAVDKGMRVTDLQLVSKEGGRNSTPPPLPPPHRPRAAPATPEEPFAPTNLIHF